jgi:hypothetical protein
MADAPDSKFKTAAIHEPREIAENPAFSGVFCIYGQGQM